MKRKPNEKKKQPILITMQDSNAKCQLLNISQTSKPLSESTKTSKVIYL